jgi:hypothetical protein
MLFNPINGKIIGREKVSKNPIKSLSSRGDYLYVIDEKFSLFSLTL